MYHTMVQLSLKKDTGMTCAVIMNRSGYIWDQDLE